MEEEDVDEEDDDVNKDINGDDEELSESGGEFIDDLYED